ncbi:hypothetical protein HW555_011565 [Spodoptera exigua]|uniref:Uncharacterized protein n=1 Tax=Spodoptera exigua TaxID=7107 RepID=A0A835G8P0_SPOEX|nr:hypothetical protein HW555_011565 [Spodoptera exigua]
MRRHRESMQKVNAFFSNLAIVLNKEKTVWNKTEEETDRNDKGVQQTIHLNLRAGSLANIFRSTKSTLKLHTPPDYVNEHLFLFPGRIENVLGTSARTGPTTGNKFKKSSTSNMPPRTSSSYKLTTDKFLGLWQQEMSNFASPDRWKIEGKYFTTQRISPGWHLNVGKIQPIAQHRRNRINRTIPSRRIDLQHNIIGKSYTNYSYLTTKQYKEFVKKSNGNLHVSTQNEEHSTFKTTVIDGRLVYLPLNSAKATTQGSVSTASTKSPNHHYYEMMNELDEGYMMIFLIELCRIISEQDLDHVQAVIIHTETIIDELYKNGTLTWLGTPLLDITVKLSRLIFERPVNFIRSQAATMYHMLRERKHALSVEVNLIIDYADFFYDDEEGEALFNSLRECKAFPDSNSSLFVSKSFDLLCSSLIENFLHPFHRLHNSDRRQRLIDFINKVIRDRFPNFTSKTLKQKRFDSKIKARETKHLPQLRAIMNLKNEIKRKLHLKHKQRNLQVHNLRKKIKRQRKDRFNRR